ncbi:MAG: beta-lactamase [Gemmatimonas sp. SM23_52]|nr:MAG: beta-lactamase [Gemmatimonas sp. SM23_52]
MRVRLLEIAHARSGDKGDTANIGLIVLRPEFYPVILESVTCERVKRHFKGICRGPVARFELANLGALNFLLHECLGGGGTLSLRTDAQGKTYGAALLRMEIEVPDELARLIEARDPETTR